MTHITGPLLWTIAIYAMGTTCSTKMAKGLPQQQHLQLGLCLFPHFTTTLNPLLLYIYLSFHILFCFTILLVFSHSLWTVLLTSNSTSSSSYPWPRVQGRDTMNGLFHAFWESFLCCKFSMLLFSSYTNCCLKVSFCFCILCHFYYYHVHLVVSFQCSIFSCVVSRWSIEQLVYGLSCILVIVLINLDSARDCCNWTGFFYGSELAKDLF